VRADRHCYKTFEESRDVWYSLTMRVWLSFGVFAVGVFTAGLWWQPSSSEGLGVPVVSVTTHGGDDRSNASPPTPSKPLESLTGIVAASRVDEIAAPTAGLLAQLPVGVGQPIEEGALVAVIEPSREFMLEAEDARQQTRLAELARERAKIALARAEERERIAQQLLQEGLWSKAQFNEAQFDRRLMATELASADAAVALRARIAEMHEERGRSARLRSPCACLVLSTSVTEGASIGQGAVILRLVRPADLRIRLVVPQHMLSAVAIGARLTVVTAASRLAAIIDAIGAVPMDGSNYTFLEARFAEPPLRALHAGELRLGAQVAVQIP
jgi:multidrug efflux pump subunit AcrA (membrane-fusion protein)